MKRTFPVLLSLGFIILSCNSGSNDRSKDPKATITGQWIIIKPEHIIYTKNAYEAYTSLTRDSLLNAFGLKVLEFGSNGEFFEGDSILAPPAKWMVKDNREFLIDGGGEGFRHFRGGFDGIRNDTMLISENLALPGDTVKIIWYLIKLDTTATPLFDKAANWWRKKPTASEDDAALSKRVKAMLEYYAVYFGEVSKKASYFSQLRVPLPFRYYQHAVGLKPFKEDLPFNAFFYNNDDAEKAHALLSTAIKKGADNKLKPGKDFVIEYASFFKKFAAAL
ncbi:MAG: hypothetical protein DI535_29965 [Citrobacter freundii]|nr:MAG: hypothetical protein DI535_29965 [Citrobacter freundii]